jgi:hypothetical protein
LRSGAVMCLACLCSHFPQLLALMWVREAGPDQKSGLEALDPKRFSHLDDRPIDIMPSAPPQP